MRALRSTPPTLEHECALAASVAEDRPVVVVGLDEVGRGAIAGPVAVGACAVLIQDGTVSRPLPADVRDSKLLSATRRDALVDPIRESAHASAIGWASPAEIDSQGIITALSLAARRALDGLGVPVDAVLLDGNVDVLADDSAPEGRAAPSPVVALRVKADRDCQSVAAASVLAKVARDAHMAELSHEAPAYGWEKNKGYGSAGHREAIGELGTHHQHRRSWNLGPSEPTPNPGVPWGSGRSDRAKQQEGRA